MTRLASVLCVEAAALMFPAFGLAAEPQIDFDVRFVPQREFSKYIPECVPGNIGFFCMHWNGDGTCTRSMALIASDVSQAERVHAIREEITQALGLMEDSWSHSDSIYYQGWTPGVHYAEIDQTLIRMLYRPDIQPNMSCQEVRNVFKGHYTKEEIDYFCEIAFGSEYASANEPIHKWMHNPMLQVSGQLSDLDIRTVNQVVNELNGLIGTIQLKVVKWSVVPAPRA